MSKNCYSKYIYLSDNPMINSPNIFGFFSFNVINDDAVIKYSFDKLIKCDNLYNIFIILKDKLVFITDKISVDSTLKASGELKYGRFNVNGAAADEILGCAVFKKIGDNLSFAFGGFLREIKPFDFLNFPMEHNLNNSSEVKEKSNVIVLEDVKSKARQSEEKENKEDKLTLAIKGELSKKFNDISISGNLKQYNLYKIPSSFIDVFDPLESNILRNLITMPMLTYSSYIKNYDHFIFGLKADSSLNYLIYGIPALKSDLKTKPFSGQTGFLNWVELNEELKTEKYDGYWVLLYSIKKQEIEKAEAAF